MSTHAEVHVVVTCAMRNVYWLASEDIASLKYNSLNDLVTLQGCSTVKDLYVSENAKYTHHQIVEEMQQCVADCIKEKIIADIFMLFVNAYHPELLCFQIKLFLEILQLWVFIILQCLISFFGLLHFIMMCCFLFGS